ncbi:MAG: hypothetical protein GWP03_01825 [Proteobacteria bacterium]|nr:hypothetical protein [Pseudomonadota bacterium]
MEDEILRKLEEKISKIESYINNLKMENKELKSKIEILEEEKSKYDGEKENLRQRLSALLQKLEQFEQV